MVDYDAWVQVGLIIDAISGAFFLAIAAAVLFVRPATVQTRWFSLFAGSFGMLVATLNLWFVGIFPAWTGWAGGAFAVVFAASALLLPFIFPTAIPLRLHRGTMAASLAVLLIVAVPTIAYDVTQYAAGVRSTHEVGAIVTFSLALGGLAGLQVATALRYARERSEVMRARSRVLAISMLPWVAWSFGQQWWYQASGASNGAIPENTPFWGHLAAPIVIAALWLYAGYRTRQRAPLVIALSGLGVCLASFLLASAIDYPRVADLGFNGVWRIVGASLLAVAVVRRHLFDLEARLKWTVSNGTVAAIVLATAFAVSEAAAQFFGDQFNSAYVGIASAALLVFAIAPLQRVGDRFAEATLPGIKPLAERSDDERLAMYRDMAEAAWEDGALSVPERRVLDRAALRLGVAPETAMLIEQEAARRR